MTTEEQIIAGIEELGKQVAEVKQICNKEVPKQEIDLSPLNKKLEAMEQYLSKLKENTTSANSEITQLKSNINFYHAELQTKLPKVDHHYVEIKHSHYWIIGMATYFILSFVLTFFLYTSNRDYKIALEAAKVNDLKYRFLRVKNESLAKYIKTAYTTNDLTTLLDTYYKKHPEEIERFVVEREEDIRKAIEANELAKQKEIEARQAQEEAEKLNQKIVPDGN